jgi:hypothetical protein
VLMRIAGMTCRRACIASAAALACLALAISGLATASTALAYLSSHNITPLPRSSVIVGAAWTSRRYDPPTNEWGDILPTIWGDDGNEYTIMDDGGTDVPLAGGVWRQSLARISGMPPRIHFTHVGDRDKPPPATFGQIRHNPGLWVGPLGPYYSSGLVEANHVFYATQELDWNWNANAPFAGLAGIAYSRNRGEDWQFANKQFPAPLGNLNWVIRGQGGFFVDGYVYAIASEREFNADRLILGRTRPDVADMTDPARWQWVSGWTSSDGLPWPVFSSSLASAVPILSWSSHLTYPQMAFDAPLHRYLMTFTYAYAAKPPDMWRDGSELMIVEGPHPWGPFSFVAAEPNFGPSNGYGAGFPINWISRNGQDVWLKWAANFDGCRPRLDCSGGYGFNYRRIHLTLAGRR